MSGTKPPTVSGTTSSSSRENKENEVWVVEEVIGGDQESIVGVFETKLDAFAFAHWRCREMVADDNDIHWGTMARQKAVRPRNGGSNVLNTHVVPYLSSEEDMWTWMIHRTPVRTN